MVQSGQVSNEEKTALLPNDDWVAMERKIYWHLPNTQQADGYGHKKTSWQLASHWNALGRERAWKMSFFGRPSFWSILVAQDGKTAWVLPRVAEMAFKI